MEDSNTEVCSHFHCWCWMQDWNLVSWSLLLGDIVSSGLLLVLCILVTIICYLSQNLPLVHAQCSHLTCSL